MGFFNRGRLLNAFVRASLRRLTVPGATSMLIHSSRRHAVFFGLFFGGTKRASFRVGGQGTESLINS